MSILPPLQYTYTNEESLELLIHSIKGNKDCNSERKAFNLCRSTVLGKHVEPEQCLDKALTFVNCFQRVRRDESAACQTAFNSTLECGKKYSESTISLGSSCQSQLDAYLNCK
ncbi:hypothetical protein ABPG74_018230 [Tetrahymena malaccensis]